MGAAVQRLRDPVHGLIVFEVERQSLDRLAWQLIDTPEFQRLRRIRQLGVSEFVFPGATHSRFAHSIGVFHMARRLDRLLRRALGKDHDPRRAAVAQIAALLHDVGHGPFSHAFENVQRQRGISKHHEKWSAEIIRNPAGMLRQLLENYEKGFCHEVASLLEAEDPSDIYHAIVSSSFDADRLDYLQRDRLMTGTGAGAIDIDWLLENLRVQEIEIDLPDPETETEKEEERRRVPTFVFDAKALPAAEQFLLARFTLHEQVYFHKTTRCVEQMIAKLLLRVAELCQNKREAPKKTGLDRDHPVMRFFQKGGETLENYLALDDLVVIGAIERMTMASDPQLKELATRLRERRLYKTLDLAAAFGRDVGRQRKEARRIDKLFKESMGDSVLKDDGAAVGIYSEIGGDDEREHKKLHILDGDRPVEISQLSEIIRALGEKKRFTRYYFAEESDRDRARRN